MSISEKEWQEEKQRVERVVSEVKGQMESLQQYAGKIKTEIIDIRRNFWDDVTVNFDEPADAAETATSIRQQAEVLSERERSHQHVYSRLQALQKLRESPYFGRIDFSEGGEEESERIYLGIASLRDAEDNFLVYDWRAPISSLYYDYSPGPVQYETPSGIVSGNMDRKRQYVIRGGHLYNMFDTGVTIGDELLQRALGQQATVQMKSIVATIQKEQNRIIRNERKGLLVVQGAAGSGKTSAALQRIAYLLYRYRENLRAEQMLLFSPNPMFNSYVSTVLPELGEENMEQTTFQELLEKRIGKGWRCLEDSFDQMEYGLTAKNQPGYPVRMKGIQVKASTSFMDVIDQYLADLGKDGLIFKDILFRGEILISAESIKKHFYSLDVSLSIPDRMSQLVKRLQGQLDHQERLEWEKPWVEEEIELLDDEAYHRVYKKLQREQRFTEETFDDFDRERQLLAEMVVRKHFRPLRKEVEQLSFLDLPAVYRQLFADADRFHSAVKLPSEWKEICAQTVERLSRLELSWEDASPYLYLKEQVEGFQTNNYVRHVFIDEAQDYSPFQFVVIKRLFPRSRMTVLGDWNQAIYAHSRVGNDGLEALSSLYGKEQTEEFILTRSYRSTQPIVQFTRELVEGGEVIEPFHRPGRKPTMIQATNEAKLAGAVAERIARL